MNRSNRANIAAQTVAILGAGEYRAPGGHAVRIAQDLRASVDATRLVTPGEWRRIVADGLATPELPEPAAIEVTGETTIAATRRLVVDERRGHVLALNFASAKNPGGGGS
jgi:uncharacterized protein (TIGR02452 family)